MDPAVARKVLPDGSIVMADHPLVGDGTQQVLLSHVAVLYLMRIFFGHQKKHPTPKPKSRSKRKQQPGGGPHKGGANAKASRVRTQSFHDAPTVRQSPSLASRRRPS